MAWSDLWEPRNAVLASRTAAGFLAAASVLALAFAHVTSQDGSTVGRVMAYVVLVLLLVVAGLLARFPDRVPSGTCMGVAIGCLVVTAVLNIETRDASVGAQLLFFFPVFYAASQLRAPAAVVTAVVAAVAQAVTVWALEPPGRATTDFSYFTVAVGCFTFLQVTAVSRQESLVGRLRRLADVDPLTGLATRRALDVATQEALGAVPPAGTAVIALDVDHFKTINDTHGHLVGDGVLVHLAEILLRSTRTSDTVARVGGDELMLLLPGCGAESARILAERIVSAVRDEPYTTPGGTRLSLSTSVGVAHVLPGTDLAPADVYAMADEDLYDAKRTGRGRVGGRLCAPLAVEPERAAAWPAAS